MRAASGITSARSRWGNPLPSQRSKAYHSTRWVSSSNPRRAASSRPTSQWACAPSRKRRGPVTIRRAQVAARPAVDSPATSGLIAAIDSGMPAYTSVVVAVRAAISSSK